VVEVGGPVSGGGGKRTFLGTRGSLPPSHAHSCSLTLQVTQLFLQETVIITQKKQGSTPCILKDTEKGGRKWWGKKSLRSMNEKYPFRFE
jgi:hypothetical protein